MSLLELRDIKKIYGEQEAEVVALKAVSFAIEQGESIAIMGTSGSGKSTLLNVLGLIEVPTMGEYFIQDKNVLQYTQRERALLRNRFFGFVMQDFALIPHYTVEQNIQLPLEYTVCSKIEKREKIRKIAEMLHIQNKLKAYPSQLSGGQKQRVAIARALINDAKVLLCDEPTGALDSKTSAEIVEIFQALNQIGKTIVIVTHDERVAECCERIIRIEDGEITGASPVSA